MNRPRLIRARRLPRRPMPFPSDSDSTWLELGATELRLRRDNGEVAWSAALPDAALTAAGAEWAARDLAALDASGARSDDDPADSEEVLLERS